MNKSALVSIIVPTYNRAHLIGQTLDSILDQTYQNWECIIVDDGSTDNTQEVVEAFITRDSRFHYFKRPETYKPGGNGARNYGSKLSKGEYINWFDSDDIMLEDFIKLKIQPFYDNDHLDVVFSAYNYFDTKGVQKRISNSCFSGNIIDDLAFGKVTYAPQSYMLRKKILIGYEFDENLKKAQDLDFFFKIFSTNPAIKISYVPEILHSIRKQHGEAISSTNDKEGLRILSKHIVNNRLFKYFSHSNHIQGIKRYKKEIFEDYKKMVDNKNYSMALKYSIRSKMLNSRQKLLVLFFVLSQLVIGKGANRIKKLV